MSSIFSGIKEAQISKGGVYVLPGVYRVMIKHVKKGRTRSAKDFVVVEMTVKESNNEKLKVGNEVSWMVTMDKDNALGNLKQFVSAVMDIPEDDVDEAGMLEIVSETNPMGGTLARISAVEIKTKAGNPFTKVTWINDKEGSEFAASMNAKDTRPAAT